MQVVSLADILCLMRKIVFCLFECVTYLREKNIFYINYVKYHIYIYLYIHILPITNPPTIPPIATAVRNQEACSIVEVVSVCKSGRLATRAVSFMSCRKGVEL